MYLFALFSFTTFTFSFNPFGDIRQNFIFILLSIHVCRDWTEPNLRFVSTKVEIYLIPFELAILSYQRIFNLWDFINNLICNLIYNWICNLIILLNYMIHWDLILQSRWNLYVRIHFLYLIRNIFIRYEKILFNVYSIHNISYIYSN